MSLFENPDNLRLLQNLLNPQQRGDDSDTDEDESLVHNNLHPGSIGPPTSLAESSAKNDSRKSLQSTQSSQPCKAPQSIEEWQAAQEKEDADILESRKRPEYTMTYRQAVGTEDVFLQMGNRTNASASCEDLILEIMLPDETMPVEKMNLSITESEVDLATALYRLKLPLVHKVDVDRCRAKYDAELRRMCLTLRLQREFDFVNF